MQKNASCSGSHGFCTCLMLPKGDTLLSQAMGGAVELPKSPNHCVPYQGRWRGKARLWLGQASLCSGSSHVGASSGPSGDQRGIP